ncbi:MAG: hypothetical protein Q8K00_17865 [Syntrophales bacterium]|nr:hypothetical protein [Syntrophales bacterium]
MLLDENIQQSLLRIGQIAEFNAAALNPLLRRVALFMSDQLVRDDFNRQFAQDEILI